MFNRNNLWLVFLFVFAIAGFSFCEEAVPIKVATVNISAVIMKSHDVQKLKEENIKANKDLETYIDNIKESLEKETDIKKRKIKEEQYSVKLQNKKNALKKDYKKKLVAVDNKITSKIQKVARINKYDFVFSKSAVLYGGDDITQLVVDK